MKRFRFASGPPLEPAWLVRDLAVALFAGVALAVSADLDMQLPCMIIFFLSAIVGFLGLYKRWLHFIIIGLAGAFVGAGCQAFFVWDNDKWHMLCSLAWAAVATEDLMSFWAVSERGVA